MTLQRENVSIGMPQLRLATNAVKDDAPHRYRNCERGERGSARSSRARRRRALEAHKGDGEGDEVEHDAERDRLRLEEGADQRVDCLPEAGAGRAVEGGGGGSARRSTRKSQLRAQQREKECTYGIRECPRCRPSTRGARGRARRWTGTRSRASATRARRRWRARRCS